MLLSTRSCLVAMLLLVPPLAGLDAPSRAQDVTCDGTSDFPCSFQLRDLKLQKVPSVFKFQSRVSQAKLPIGEGVFNTVFVKLLRGTEVKCIEQFQNVQVVDSVLNLEIGRNMNCEMDEVIAENADLAFQICPGGQENCLQPVSLGAAPYAIKASFASVAQQAHHANIAGQASYAHRVTADRDLLIRNRIGTGYFDFFTPTAEDAVALYGDSADFEPFENSGFIQWTPVRDRTALDVHMCAKGQDDDRLTKLRSLHLAAIDTYAKGDMTVQPVAGGKGLTVTLEGAHITGNSDFDGTLTVTLGTTVQSGGIHVTGNSDVAGELVVSNRTTVSAGGVQVTGDSTVDGTLTASGATTVQSGGVQVTGDSTVDGTLNVSQALAVAAGGAVVSGLLAGLDGLEIAGDAHVSGRLTAQDAELIGAFSMLDGVAAAHRIMAFNGAEFTLNPDTSVQATRVNGPVRFTGPVIFEGGTVDPGAADAFVLAQGEVRDIALGGALSVFEEARFLSGVAGGLVVSGLTSATNGLLVDGTATFNGPIVATGGVSGNLAVTGGVQTSAASTFNGSIAVPGGVAGNVAVGGTLSVAGTASFPGGIGAASFSGTLTALGATALAGVTVGGTLAVAGGAVFNGGASFPGGVTGNVAFANNVAVAGTTNLQGNANVTGDLTIDGTTTFNGPVAFGGAFSGLTRFQDISVSSTATFLGPVALPGGVTGTLTADSVDVQSSLVVQNAATFKGAVDFQGNAVTMPNLVVTGNSTFQGQSSFPGGLTSLLVGTLTVSGSTTVSGSLTVNNGLTVHGAFRADCRICLNYGDNNGLVEADKRHACIRMEHGAFSGIFNLSGDVNADDVLSMKFLCDNGANESGNGWR